MQSVLVYIGYPNQIELGKEYIKSIMGEYEPVDASNGDVPSARDTEASTTAVDSETNDKCMNVDITCKSDREVDANIGTKTSGMHVLRTVVDLESNTTCNVVLRSIIQNFWQMVIGATETYRVCVVGTPGIGKTTTTCILIRLLLTQKKTVVYHVRTERNLSIRLYHQPTQQEILTYKSFRKTSLNVLIQNIITHQFIMWLIRGKLKTIATHPIYIKAT
jgi:ABC-type glutathione transport system ATPase component